MFLPRYRLRTLSLAVVACALWLAAAQATAWSTPGATLIFAMWVAVPSALIGGWRSIARIDSDGAQFVLGALWAVASLAAAIALPVGTVFVVLLSRGVPACGPLAW